ncbi:hypothetical protein F8M41_015823 [Gigaspora margarita]|uniref:Uncharacterized protein n=1 Tax=Gigaspora margarita TaxID=4874 RepID=A0A8H4EMY4_GIGMA|nr:hypothetical protein F8M41_015823 [Gigaspora margarita]
MDVSKISSKEDFTDIIVMLSIRPAKTRKLHDSVFTENKTCNAWPFNKFLKQEPYRTISKKLRDYRSKYAFRIHSGKKPIPQHLKLLSRIIMRQESDCLDANNNYTIGDTELEESDSEPETSNRSKPKYRLLLHLKQ